MPRIESSKYPLGVVLGKFMPPHHGHRLVIRTAIARSEHVAIVVCSQKGDPIPVNVRMDWLRRLYPNVVVTMLVVDFPVNDEVAWTRGTERAVGQRPSAVFSSEGYGHRLAELMPCEHVLVDRERLTVPVSASQILRDPMTYREFVDPIVFEYLKSAPIGQD